MLAKLYPADGGAAGRFPVEPLPWAALRGDRPSPQNEAAGHAVSGSLSAFASETTPERRSFQAELEVIQNELDKSQREADARSQQSYETGFEEGRRQGLAQNQAEVDACRQQIAASLHNLARARMQVIERADEDLVHLGIAIAEKILNRQVQIDPDALRGLVSGALSKLGGKTVHRVSLHPDDHAAVQRELDLLGPRRAIRIETDPSLSRGSLVFDTDFGTFDASLTTQLDEVERGLVDRLRRSAP